MKVAELAEAFKQLEAHGHGDLDVRLVMGNGKEKTVCGWELVSVVSHLNGQDVRLRLFVDSPF